MFRRSLLLPILAGLVLASCTDNGLTDVKLPASAGGTLAAQASTMVPITWKYKMMGVGTDLIYCDNSDGSPPFIAFPVNWRTEGSMTHLGLVDTETSAADFSTCTIEIEDGVPVSGVGYGNVSIVGANGDAIMFSGALTLDFATYSASGTWTITGGTGRFEGASGWLTTFEVPAADGSGSVGSGSGMITPPGVAKH